MKRFNSEKLLKIVAYVFTFIFVIVIALPLVYISSLSLQDDTTIYRYPPKLLPEPGNSISIVIDYSKFKNKSANELEDLLLRDSTVAMYSTIYELNTTVVGEVKIYGTMNGKTIYYQRAHGMMLRLQMQYGVYKMSSVTPKVLLSNNRYQTSAKEIGYKFNINGLAKQYTTGAEFGQDEISKQITYDLNGAYKINGEYKGTNVKSSYLLVMENYKYYYLMPTYAYKTYDVIRKYSFLAFIFNTCLTFVWAVVCQVVLCSLTAYPLARLLSKKVSNYVMIFFLITMMIPFVSIMVPQMLLVKDMGMMNNYGGMLVTWLLPAPFYIFLFKGFFERLPSAFFEAAEIDGSTALNTFLKICIPMSKPIITMIALQSFISGWGDFFWYYLIANKPNLWTLNVAIYTMGAAKGAVMRQNFLMGLSLITILPVLGVTAIFSKQIKASVIGSGIKG